MSSVREKTTLREKRICPLRKKELSSVREETLFKKIGTVKIFQQPRSSLFEETLFNVEEDALQQSRKRPSCLKKGMFYKQEGHVLKS